MQTASKLSLLALIASLSLAGCSAAETSAPEVTQTPTSTQTVEPEPEPVYLAAPLTGVEYLEGTNPSLELPAISAKIDNTYNGRPQVALNDADVVYVTRVEAGLTRLLAVWQSRVPEAIGPVRSVRPVDAAIVDPYNGVFVYSGGQVPFKSAAKATGLVMSDEDTEQGNDTYFREESRVAPWNLYFRAAQLQINYTEQPAPAPSFEFAAVPSAVALGVPVEALEVKYPSLRSTWDLGEAAFAWSEADEPAWLRTMDGKEHVQTDGSRIISKNVVVMEVVHDLSFVDPKYGAIPKAKLVDNSGVAHIFSDGYYIKATWSKGASDAPILLKLESGESVKLAVGNTWIEMMDSPKSTLKVTEPGAE
ncbi:MAG: DUF3048 domain-containing protein [Aquiluna sp.]|nr:DUF3048 domain-containing protein [Aquiluna sp.]MCF8545820.1 DUF3048 domain-containing protein [Aquiluna sp.]